MQRGRDSPPRGESTKRRWSRDFGSNDNGGSGDMKRPRPDFDRPMTPRDSMNPRRGDDRRDRGGRGYSPDGTSNEDLKHCQYF